MKRSGFIDQFLAFMIIFVAFVSLLFLIIGYSNISRLQNNMDTMANIVARMFSTGKTADDVINRINSVKLGYFATATTSDMNISCLGSTNKIVVTISSSYDPPVLGVFNINSASSAYNEQNSSDCNVSIYLCH
ncbi:MAG: hypothetical protein JHC37_01285 [Campylobacteraceae bacterium]|nr:hypothetical protein [Campylobacteraceae bacterium]